MKTEYDREPELSITYKHVGVQVTFSAKLIAQEYLSIAGSDEENEEHTGVLFDKSLPKVMPQVASQLMRFHSLFEEALRQAQVDLIVSLAKESLKSDEEN